MSGVTIRAVLLVGIILVAWVVVGRWERRRPRRIAVGLPRGLVLVVGRDCRLCPAAVRRLGTHGARFTVVDQADPRFRSLGIRSVPTALVVGADGTAMVRRSGRAVLEDADLLVTQAGSVA